MTLPLVAMFLTDKINFTINLGRVSSKDHLCQVIFNLAQYFLTRRFFMFLLYIHGKN